MSLEERVKRLERDYDHVLNVMAAQRENIGKAFSQVQTALLEQEMTLRTHLQKVQATLQEMAAQVDEHQAWRVRVEERLGRLEEGGASPAA
ncbi:hypothetical protein DYH09_10115 [bacterium CPR1]|nr:hypothetical protein [bacterium CPR1]